MVRRLCDEGAIPRPSRPPWSADTRSASSAQTTAHHRPNNLARRHVALAHRGDPRRICPCGRGRESRVGASACAEGCAAGRTRIRSCSWTCRSRLSARLRMATRCVPTMLGPIAIAACEAAIRQPLIARVDQSPTTRALPPSQWARTKCGPGDQVTPWGLTVDPENVLQEVRFRQRSRGHNVSPRSRCIARASRRPRLLPPLAHRCSTPAPSSCAPRTRRRSSTASGARVARGCFFDLRVSEPPTHRAANTPSTSACVPQAVRVWHGSRPGAAVPAHAEQDDPRPVPARVVPVRHRRHAAVALLVVPHPLRRPVPGAGAPHRHLAALWCR